MPELFAPIPSTPVNQSLKFCVGNTIHEHTFSIIDDADVLFDCLIFHIKSFQTLMSSAVTENQQAMALFMMFPCTLVHPNYYHVWVAVVANPLAQMIEVFNQCIQAFIAEFYTAADHVLLAKELRFACLPHLQCVTCFVRALEHHNKCITHLPGNKPNLLLDQLKDVFLQAMPTAWKNNWNNFHPSTSLHDIALSLLVESVAHQQHLSIEKHKKILKNNILR